jgi:tetratricopeptide (TPR) repeat protein
MTTNGTQRPNQCGSHAAGGSRHLSAETVRKILETARATFEQLATSALDDLTLQREFGDTYEALGDLEQALRAYRDGLAIAERLAVSDPTNTEWQRGLSVSYSRIGNVLMAQGKLDEALQAYRDTLVTTERLAALDRSNTLWQSDLEVTIANINGIAGNLILAHNFVTALEAVDQAISLAPDKVLFYKARFRAGRRRIHRREWRRLGRAAAKASASKDLKGVKPSTRTEIPVFLLADVARLARAPISSLVSRPESSGRCSLHKHECRKLYHCAFGFFA